jgi:hypothetical protein
MKWPSGAIEPVSVIVLILGGDRELFGTGVGGEGIAVVAFAQGVIAGRRSFIIVLNVRPSVRLMSSPPAERMTGRQDRPWPRRLHVFPPSVLRWPVRLS